MADESGFETFLKLAFLGATAYGVYYVFTHEEEVQAFLDGRSVGVEYKNVRVPVPVVKHGGKRASHSADPGYDAVSAYIRKKYPWATISGTPGVELSAKDTTGSGYFKDEAMNGPIDKFAHARGYVLKSIDDNELFFEGPNY